ncbi:hypothetical protein Rhopal_002847-T1 [Rhodotorula paludigena]|uniref:Copper acquisition factor BIM1-like domain-containing protein n=1 Tax=Rhodotorula paludigena TaxID=86838 RepID=A0AAV5GMF6_9BASI|nr:hypothetical protein Rhopal_002847-T1 [Rhodotorula paludigena]
MVNALALPLLAAAVSASPLVARQSRNPPAWPGVVSWSFPGSRGWIEGGSNTGPCNTISYAGADNSTTFPLTGGDLSVALTRDVYNLTISAARASESGELSAFEQVLPMQDHTFSGEQCFDAPDFASLGYAAGDAVTLSIVGYGGPSNVSIYQCADLQLVNAADFTAPADFTCQNVTRSTLTTRQTNSTLLPSETQEAAASEPTSGAGKTAVAGWAGAALTAVAFALAH